MKSPRQILRNSVVALVAVTALAGCTAAGPALFHLGSPTSEAGVAPEQEAPSPVPVPSRSPESRPEYKPGPSAQIDVVSDWTHVQAANSGTYFRVLRINGACFVQEYQGDLVLAPGACDQ